MFRFLYGLSLRSYVLLVRMASLWHPKARLWLSGRKGLLGKVKGHFAPTDQVVWFHASSLGEFEQGRPLMEAIRERHPEKKLLLTFYSPSGYEVRKNDPVADLVCYLPVDTLGRAKAFVEAVHPEAFFFIKYDFWFNLLYVLKKRGVKVYLVSGIFRRKQHFFQWWGRWFLKNLESITWFFLQDEPSVQLLGDAGFHNASISGDTRFDRVIRIAEGSSALSAIDPFLDGSPLIVAGSTWPPDEHLLQQAIGKMDGVKWIIAPHQVDEPHVRRLMNQLPEGSCRLSAGGFDQQTNVLVVDSIGMLNRLYRVATLAYVGGGFGKGIHNLLEAAVYGCPVVFGPNYRIFREAHDLIRLGGGFTIRTADQLFDTINHLLLDDLYRQTAAEAARSYVMSGKGATLHILAQAGYH